MRLPRAVLYAGQEVRITGAACGAMQVLAGRRAFVGGAAHLTCPSVVYAQGQAMRTSTASDSAPGASGDPSPSDSSLPRCSLQPSPTPSGVELAGRAVVDGALLFAPETASAESSQTGTQASSQEEGAGQNSGLIVVGRGATLRGALYSAGRAEPHGRIDGTALAHEFSFYRLPTSYVDWIDGARIDPGRRPAGYVAPISLKTEGPLAFIRLGALPEGAAPLAAP